MVSLRKMTQHPAQEVYHMVFNIYTYVCVEHRSPGMRILCVWGAVPWLTNCTGAILFPTTQARIRFLYSSAFDSFVDFWLYMLRYCVASWFWAFTANLWHRCSTPCRLKPDTSRRHILSKPSHSEHPHPSLVLPRGSVHLSELRWNSLISSTHLAELPFPSLMLRDIPQPPTLLVGVDCPATIT